MKEFDAMRRELFLFFAAILLVAAVFLLQQSPQTNPQNCPACISPSARVFFCPEQNCAEKLIEKINSSANKIDVAIYSFTHDGIAQALISAKNKGVKVRVLMESQQAGSEYSDDEKLANAGIQVKFMDNPQGIMHNKFSIFDSNIVATGSFNYTANADEHNNENLVFIESKAIAREYETEFQKLWGAS